MATFIGITGLNKSSNVRVPVHIEVDTPPGNLAGTVAAGDGGYTYAADEYFYVVTALGETGEGLPSTEDSETVVNAGTSEIQTVTVDAAGGTYTLTFDGEETTAIAYNASASTGADSVRAKLEALPNIGAGDVTVTGGPGDVGGTTPYTITFGANLAYTNVSTLVSDPALLTGGAGTAVVAVDTPGVNADKVTLTWDASAGALGYRVYKGTATGVYDGYYTTSTNSYVDTGRIATSGTPPTESTAVVGGDNWATVKPGTHVIVDVDDVKARQTLGHHQSIGQWVVCATNNEYKDTDGTFKALPANA